MTRRNYIRFLKAESEKFDSTSMETYGKHIGGVEANITDMSHEDFKERYERSINI